MATVRDKLWLWGQSPDGHNAADGSINYNLPGHSRMTAMEGNIFFGIPNCCRVRILGHPQPPYDQESLVMDSLDQVVWSLLGAGGEQATEWGDLEEVLRQARMFPNITGGVFDDFVSPVRLPVYTPEKLRAMRKRLREDAGRPLDMWVVYYERDLYRPELNDQLLPRLQEFDVVTFWTWYGNELANLERNLDTVISMLPGKRMMAGCYLWDYGNKRPLPPELMEHQCQVYLDYLQRGKIDGIIVCSNCIADLGIEAVDWMRRWIREKGSIQL